MSVSREPLVLPPSKSHVLICETTSNVNMSRNADVNDKNIMPGVSGLGSVQNGGVEDGVPEYAGNGFSGSSDTLVCQTPASSKGVFINIYSSCVAGSCRCVYDLGGNQTQLKPCRFGALIFVGRSPTENEVKVFEAILHGVDIVSSEVGQYECDNYTSILQPHNRVKMDKLISDELSNGMLSLAEVKPECVLALGAVDKPDGRIRPITDCSRPENYVLMPMWKAYLSQYSINLLIMWWKL